ncbi:hypothetical protein [Halorhabdus salina]|uniref:hypothetical protein n=1 Tax=Halorhabdus salina TaxID=2750670 RepID=UPI0015EEA58E|nr:hypothetical protein [Halorhabdus salina]
MNVQGAAHGWKEAKSEFEEEVSNPEEELATDDIEDLDEDSDRISQKIDEFEDEISLYDRRFNLRATLTSAFEHGGKLYSECDWELIESLSFTHHESGPADLFVAHSNTHGTIILLALVKEENTTDTYHRIQDLCEYVDEELDSVQDELSVEIDEDNIEGAIATTGVSPEAVAGEMGQLNGESPVSVWELESGNDQKITVIEDVDGVSWSGHTPNGTLGNLLSEGQEVANTKQLGINIFYDSHHHQLIRHLPAFLHNKHFHDDRKNFYFDKDELIQFLLQTKGDVNRNSAGPRAKNLIEWWSHVGIITDASDPENYSDDVDVYSLPISVLTEENIEGLVTNYKKKVARTLLKKGVHESMGEPQNPSAES